MPKHVAMWLCVVGGVFFRQEIKKEKKILTHYSFYRPHLPVSALVELCRISHPSTSYPQLPIENYCSPCQEGAGF